MTKDFIRTIQIDLNTMLNLRIIRRVEKDQTVRLKFLNAEY